MKHLTLAAGLVALSVTAALAITAPASTSFAYDLYEIAVEKIITGPIGFASGVLAVVCAAHCVITNKIPHAVTCVVAGTALLKSKDIVVSLGNII